MRYYHIGVMCIGNVESFDGRCNSHAFSALQVTESLDSLVEDSVAALQRGLPQLLTML